MTTEVTGVGLGLRRPLVEELLALTPADVPELRWLECHPENYMRRGGAFPAALEACLARWPMVTHGLTMSLGGEDPLDHGYLHVLAEFLSSVATPWHSDHLCFSTAHGVVTHDLLPIPYCERAVEHVAARIRQAQEHLSVPLAVENVSYYATPPGGTMDEGDFIAAVVDRADCPVMLDVNNVYVNAVNHGYDPRVVLAKMPLDRVVQMHVAGHFHDQADGVILDTHAATVADDVYALVAWTLERTGQVPILLERDDEFPPLDDLLCEVRRLDALWRAAPRRKTRQ